MVAARAGLEVLERALCDGLCAPVVSERVENGRVEAPTGHVRALGPADRRRRARARLELDERRLDALEVCRDGRVVPVLERVDEPSEVFLLEPVVEVLARGLDGFVDVEFVLLEPLEQSLRDGRGDAVLAETVPLVCVGEPGPEERGL